jgi:hypothetical protein
MKLLFIFPLYTRLEIYNVYYYKYFSRNASQQYEKCNHYGEERPTMILSESGLSLVLNVETAGPLKI